MNEGHIIYLSSPEWRAYLETELFPWAFSVAPIEGAVLEVGPGPGLTTDVLRARVDRVVAVEVDPDLAGALAARLGGGNVEVVCADASDSGLPSDEFDAATCFTMLHHVPTSEKQDALFREMQRVLQPGGHLVGVDSTDSPELRVFHADDTFVPVDLSTLGARLESAGFIDVHVESWFTGPRPGPKVRFHAAKPN